MKSSEDISNWGFGFGMLVLAALLVSIGKMYGEKVPAYDKHIAQITCLELEIGKDKCNQIFEVENEK